VCPPIITVVNRPKHKVKFLANYVKSCNSLCVLFACVAQKELIDAPLSNSLTTYVVFFNITFFSVV